METLRKRGLYIYNLHTMSKEKNFIPVNLFEKKKLYYFFVSYFSNLGDKTPIKFIFELNFVFPASLYNGGSQFRFVICMILDYLHNFLISLEISFGPVMKQYDPWPLMSHRCPKHTVVFIIVG